MKCNCTQASYIWEQWQAQVLCKFNSIGTAPTHIAKNTCQKKTTLNQFTSTTVRKTSHDNKENQSKPRYDIKKIFIHNWQMGNNNLVNIQSLCTARNTPPLVKTCPIQKSSVQKLCNFFSNSIYWYYKSKSLKVVTEGITDEPIRHFLGVDI